MRAIARTASAATAAARVHARARSVRASATAALRDQVRARARTTHALHALGSLPQRQGLVLGPMPSPVCQMDKMFETARSQKPKIGAMLCGEIGALLPRAVGSRSAPRARPPR